MAILSFKSKAKLANHSHCHGCSLCLLSCPMWQQHRDVSFSPKGFAKALQHGGQAEDMKQALSSCIMCGACDVLCPENIDLTAMISSAWQQTGLQDMVVESVHDNYFAMSCDPSLETKLGIHDFYIIDAKAFHADHTHRLAHYDSLRKHTGCKMNLDLHRLAIPTGNSSSAAMKQTFDVTKQVEWLIQGRSFERVIVENPADKTIFEALTGKPVLSLLELLGWSSTINLENSVKMSLENGEENAHA